MAIKAEKKSEERKSIFTFTKSEIHGANAMDGEGLAHSAGGAAQMPGRC
jgi:hypothetical protein